MSVPISLLAVCLNFLRFKSLFAMRSCVCSSALRLCSSCQNPAVTCCGVFVAYLREDRSPFEFRCFAINTEHWRPQQQEVLEGNRMTGLANQWGSSLGMAFSRSFSVCIAGWRQRETRQTEKRKRQTDRDRGERQGATDRDWENKRQSESESESERERRQTDGDKDRQTEREDKDRQTQRNRERQAETGRHRQRERGETEGDRQTDRQRKRERRDRERGRDRRGARQKLTSQQHTGRQEERSHFFHHDSQVQTEIQPSSVTSAILECMQNMAIPICCEHPNCLDLCANLRDLSNLVNHA